MSSVIRLMEKHRGRLERAGVLPADGGTRAGVAGCGLTKAQVRQLTRPFRGQACAGLTANQMKRLAATARKNEPQQDMKTTPAKDEWQTVPVRSRASYGVDASYNHRHGIVALNPTAIEKAEDLGLAGAIKAGCRVEVQYNRHRRCMRLVPVAAGGLTLGKPGAGKRALHVKSRALIGVFDGPVEFEVVLEARAGAKIRALELRPVDAPAAADSTA